MFFFFFFQAEDGIRDGHVTGVQTCALPILLSYAYDFEVFKQKCRSIYYDLNVILPRPLVKEEEELLEKIKDRHWCSSPQVKSSYENFRKTFHSYLYGDSGRRLMEAILNL